jgi:hypothetical protein
MLILLRPDATFYVGWVYVQPASGGGIADVALWVGRIQSHQGPGFKTAWHQHRFRKRGNRVGTSSTNERPIPNAADKGIRVHLVGAC